MSGKDTQCTVLLGEGFRDSPLLNGLNNKYIIEYKNLVLVTGYKVPDNLTRYTQGLPERRSWHRSSPSTEHRPKTQRNWRN